MMFLDADLFKFFIRYVRYFDLYGQIKREFKSVRVQIRNNNNS